VTTHRRGGLYRWRVLAATAIALGGAALAPTTGLPAEASDHAVDPSTRVIVQAEDGLLEHVGRVAGRMGAQVVSTQQSLDTAVLDVPADKVDDLRHVDGVRTVTEDMSVTLNSFNSTTGDAGDLLNVADQIGAFSYWGSGYVGQNVDVALLDSGVLPVAGLTTPNKLVIGPDFSAESQYDNLRDLDTFGHGTHMAGIIAGLDNGLTPATFATAQNRFVGVAPGARIVSVKLADAKGRTDVSQVIAGIDWVIRHAHDPGMNIRVLNLSFGQNPAKDYRIDPLAHAAEVAWDSGVVVVVSAGNGDTPGNGLSSPAYDPSLLAVGSVDTKGTSSRRDDTVPGFSRKGSSTKGKRGPDLVAPGVSLVSLRAPGSLVDDTFGSTGRVGTRFFRGTGTSQSAAVVSGAAALMLSERPSLSPDQVRGLLRQSAYQLPGASDDAQGEGGLDLTVARRLAAKKKVSAPKAPPLTSFDQLAGTLPTGQDTAAGGDWLDYPGSGASWNGTKWRGATWAGATWAGATWAGSEWDGATWAGATWAGATWAGATWAGATWAGATWAGATWSSDGWD
jgi:subtilase family protein